MKLTEKTANQLTKIQLIGSFILTLLIIEMFLPSFKNDVTFSRLRFFWTAVVVISTGVLLINKKK